MDDARIAVETGVDGLDVVIGTSSILREFSHGKDMDYIIKQATEVIKFIQSKGLEVRFSSEDSFRSDLVDLLGLYKTVDKVSFLVFACIRRSECNILNSSESIGLELQTLSAVRLLAKSTTSCAPSAASFLATSSVTSTMTLDVRLPMHMQLLRLVPPTLTLRSLVLESEMESLPLVDSWLACILPTRTA